jgi:hypothetical protein
MNTDRFGVRIFEMSAGVVEQWHALCTRLEFILVIAKIVAGRVPNTIGWGESPWVPPRLWSFATPSTLV